jgi:hypothetical protein
MIANWFLVTNLDSADMALTFAAKTSVLRDANANQNVTPGLEKNGQKANLVH